MVSIGYGIIRRNMFPILFSVGTVHLYSLSVFLVLSWCVFSFLFWRAMREEGVVEEWTFDFMFYGTLAAFVGARAAFVLTHWDAFGESYLKIGALWVAPGLSLYGGIVSMIAVMLLLRKRHKVRMGSILDSIALSLPAGLIVGKIGSLLDGAEIGTPATLPWAVLFPGHVGSRHPVQLYEIMVLVLLFIVVFFLKGRAIKDHWSYGMVGAWFFMCFGAGMFALEFFKDGGVYWHKLRANQWVLVALTCEAFGAFYVRGGGKLATKKAIATISMKASRFLGAVYEKFSKRHTV